MPRTHDTDAATDRVNEVNRFDNAAPPATANQILVFDGTDWVAVSGLIGPPLVFAALATEEAV